MEINTDLMAISFKSGVELINKIESKVEVLSNIILVRLFNGEFDVSRYKKSYRLNVALNTESKYDYRNIDLCELMLRYIESNTHFTKFFNDPKLKITTKENSENRKYESVFEFSAAPNEGVFN